MKEITEEQVRRIAKQEDAKVEKKLTKKIGELEGSINENTVILKRLERLLLGEIGINETDTLKARSNYAYMYAKKNTDMRIIERAVPALRWFEDMGQIEPGCEESKLETLGRMITFYSNIRWILGIIGVSTVINAIPVIEMIISWIERFAS